MVPDLSNHFRKFISIKVRLFDFRTKNRTQHKQVILLNPNYINSFKDSFSLADWNFILDDDPENLYSNFLKGGTAPQTSFLTVYAFFSKTTTHW